MLDRCDSTIRDLGTKLLTRYEARHPKKAEAELRAFFAPDGLTRAFFTSGGVSGLLGLASSADRQTGITRASNAVERMGWIRMRPKAWHA